MCGSLYLCVYYPKGIQLLYTNTAIQRRRKVRKRTFVRFIIMKLLNIGACSVVTVALVVKAKHTKSDYSYVEAILLGGLKGLNLLLYIHYLLTESIYNI